MNHQDGYAEAFRADYRRLKWRRDELLKTLASEDGDLNGCPADLLGRQVEYMSSLLYALAARAKYEGLEI